MTGGHEDRKTTDEALAAFGFEREGGDDGSVEIWPETAHAAPVFADLLTQWNVAGMGGLIGLRYEALPMIFDLHGIPASDRRDLLADIRVMEAAVIKESRRGK